MAVDSKYLTFVSFRRAEHKTLTCNIYAKSSNILLGRIKWYGSWRQFCFFPEPDTIFNPGCIADIQAQIEEMKQERLAAKALSS